MPKLISIALKKVASFQDLYNKSTPLFLKIQQGPMFGGIYFGLGLNLFLEIYLGLRFLDYGSLSIS